MNRPVSKDTFSEDPLYEHDFYAWCFRQAKLLEDKQFSDLDITHLVEEMESMGKQERDKLESNLTILFCHLLKWIYQSEKRSKSWKASVAEHRRRTIRSLKENPSLKGSLVSIAEEAYYLARAMAAQQTNLEMEIFPEDMPFSWQDALREDFLPQSVASCNPQSPPQS